MTRTGDQEIGAVSGRLSDNPGELACMLCIFSSFELKLCRVVELCILKNPIFFLFFDVNGVWRENDVTRLTAKLTFQDMRKTNK